MSRKPTAEATSAYARLMRVQHSVLAAVEKDLKDAGFPPLAWYDALLELSRRGVANNMRFIMTAKQWEHLKLVMDLHEEQLAHATVYDIEKAHDFVLKVIRMGKARAIVQTRKEGT